MGIQDRDYWRERYNSLTGHKPKRGARAIYVTRHGLASEDINADSARQRRLNRRQNTKRAVHPLITTLLVILCVVILWAAWAGHR